MVAVIMQDNYGSQVTALLMLPHLPYASLFYLPLHPVSFPPLSLPSGRFREKASILHKIAKKKCQVDENERQNGAANHVGEYRETSIPCLS